MESPPFPAATWGCAPFGGAHHPFTRSGLASAVVHFLVHRSTHLPRQQWWPSFSLSLGTCTFSDQVVIVPDHVDVNPSFLDFWWPMAYSRRAAMVTSNLVVDPKYYWAVSPKPCNDRYGVAPTVGKVHISTMSAFAWTVGTIPSNKSLSSMNNYIWLLDTSASQHISGTLVCLYDIMLFNFVLLVCQTGLILWKILKELWNSGASSLFIMFFVCLS